MTSLHKSFVWRRAAHGLAVCAAGSITGCSTLTPQVFTDDLVTGATPAADSCSAAPHPMKLETALQRAGAAQRRYTTAVQNLSEVGTGTSAALIGLATAALFKGITHPNSQDLAGLGIAGSATYAYGSTMTSRPRQQVYLNGAVALNCAMDAATSYTLPKGWLRSSEPAPAGVESIDDMADQADAALPQLDQQLAVLDALNRPTTREAITGAPASPRCKTVVPEQCAQPAAGASADRTRRYELCVSTANALRDACAGPVKTERKLQPHPDIALDIQRLERVRRSLVSLSATARRQAVVFGAAGDALCNRTTAVQFAVARQVLATEPDLAAVLNAATSLRSTAFNLSAAPALEPRAATTDAGAGGSQAVLAQSDITRRKPAVPEVNERPDAALQAAEQVADAAERIATKLHARLVTMRDQVRTANARLAQCASDQQGGLQISPNVDEVSLAPGGSKSFTVSGGTGLPTASLGTSDAKVGELSRTLDGAFVFKAAADAADGSSAVLHFRDGTGTSSRDVTIKIERAGAADASTTSIDRLSLPALAAALGLPSSPAPNQKEVMARIEACQRDKMHLPAPDAHELDAATKDFILSGKCNG